MIIAGITVGPTTYKGEHSQYKLLDLKEAYAQLTESMGRDYKEAGGYRGTLIRRAEDEQAEEDKAPANTSDVDKRWMKSWLISTKSRINKGEVINRMRMNKWTWIALQGALNFLSSVELAY